MEKTIFFFKIIAWVIGVLTTLITFLCLYLGMKYPGSLEETIDRLGGVKKTYPVMPWFIAALVCWAFIIAF